MNNNQQLMDSIVCHKSAIKQIDDKLNLITFIGSVNNSFVPKDFLNMDELKQERKILEKNLKSLTITFKGLK